MIAGNVRRYEIVERSMAPALLPGDYTLAIRRREPLLRGDVVVFPHPDQPGMVLVKRVIGMPGETITIASGRVLIGGDPFPDPWARGPTLPDGEWRLETDEVLVLGDNRPSSTGDGRTIGPLPERHLRWKVVARYWPLRR